MRRFRNNKPYYVIFTLSRDISEILLKCPFVHKMSKVLYHNSNKYFQRSHRALGTSGCLSKMDIFLGVLGYLSEMAQRCIFTWVSLDIFERSLKHLSKIYVQFPGYLQGAFKYLLDMSIYLNVCRYSLTLDNSIEIQIVYSSGIWQFKYRFLSMMQEVQLITSLLHLLYPILEVLGSFRKLSITEFRTILQLINVASIYCAIQFRVFDQ